MGNTLCDRRKGMVNNALSAWRKTNEAKCQETQIDGWQEDKGDDADSAAETNPIGR